MKRIIYYGILIFVFSIGIGYYYSGLLKKEKTEVSYENSLNMVNNKSYITETSSDVEEKLSYNAKFGIKKNYSNCGHSKIQYSELPIELVNLKRDEVENLYPNLKIEVFDKDNLVLSQDISGFCDEHFALKLGNENIEIYHIGNLGDFELMKTTNISKEYLTSTDINNLEEGICVYGIENLNSALEDFE